MPFSASPTTATQRTLRVWDISPPVHAGAPVFPGDTPYRQRWAASIGPGCPVNVSEITLSPHVGAHADAPLHYDADGASIGDTDIAPFLGPCRVIHAIGRGPLVTWADIAHAIDDTLPARVLVRTYERMPVDRWDPQLAAYAPDTVERLAARGVQLVTAARERGLDATCETCPHYLLLCEDDLEALGPLGKCAPPIRSAAERDALWEELRAGRIDLVASDHSPAPPSMKQGDDAFAVWGGVSGCQSLLASLLGRLPAADVARLTATAPSARLRLPGKGRIEPGADADLALVRFGDVELTAGELADRHRHNPYVGRTFGGRVERTFLRGEDATKPRGRLLRPAR